MFEVGDFVVYGNKGVCQIISVGSIDMPGVPKDKLYYTMSQVYLRNSTIFTPVDTDKLRRVLTKDEAKTLIESISSIIPVTMSDDKEREKFFTETLRTADCQALLEMIILLYHRRESRIANGKKATSTDERYFHAAEDILYGELGIALGLKKEEVRTYVMDTVVMC